MNCLFLEKKKNNKKNYHQSVRDNLHKLSKPIFLEKI